MGEVESAYLLAFDTANEAVAVGLGRLVPEGRRVELVAQSRIAARRASNTRLLGEVDALCAGAGVGRRDLACVVVGRGPGSFTGVRIAMATAKGVASALRVGLVGVSSLDAVAWNAQAVGVRGALLVAADAMRKEVYPVRFLLDEGGARRLNADRVVKADAFAEELAGGEGAFTQLQIVGDALGKYADLFAPFGTLLPEGLWTPTGEGLLAAAQDAWRRGEADPLDVARHDPAFALPVYTRLSDAEENERARLAERTPKNLTTGVRESSRRGGGGLARRVTMADASEPSARPDGKGIVFRPLDAAHAGDVAALEAEVVGSDAWSAAMVADELPRRDRTWWAAYALPAGDDERLVGYAGGWVVDGGLQILKVGVASRYRRQGLACALLARVAEDARGLGAQEATLEVRVGNASARAFYRALGLTSLGVRPRYYSDGEDADIMSGPIEALCDARGGGSRDARDGGVPGGVAGMELQHHEGLPASGGAPSPASGKAVRRPLLFAIESSCDETAAAVVDGDGNLLADVVASQIDFHARFGGVVPEIASRKHIEAICGVCDECLDVAARSLGMRTGELSWADMDAVAVTYAPGLLGALVVGMAFAKGVAWAAEKPLVGVNHLEGHLYANKIGSPGFTPPAVASLVSGGNTMLVHMRGWGDYRVLGETIDDAVGEAFDKVSKALGLGYPGGPAVSAQAERGNPDAIAFPRAMIHSGDLRFSLSGLKTAVITYINKEREAGRPLNVPDVCASFQRAVVDVQVKKAADALRQTGAPTFCLGGGVAANPELRRAYERLCEEMGVRLVMPPLASCGDNAGMIALAALDRYRAGRFFGLDADAKAHANLEEPY